MLCLEPAGTQTEFDSAARHLVHLRDRDGEHARKPEGRAGHEGAQPDGGGLARQSPERDPGIGGAGQARRLPERHEVIGAKECPEPAGLRGLRDA